MPKYYHKVDSDLTSIQLCIDSDSKEMVKFLSDPKNKKKMNMIINSIETRNTNLTLYERYKKIADNVSAMKFTRGKDNARIYCYLKKASEVEEKDMIIMSEFIPKKSSDKLDKKLIAKLEAISDYEYKPFSIQLQN